MHLLYSIVYAAHAKGTHHKLALDALRHLRCIDADLWQCLFLKHVKLYLEGSKAPDDEFKDFKNHVLHTRDGYWGGAPDKVRSWYQHLVEALAQQDWATAVYCAGVLSHYYTDPLQPLHTAQSEAENSVHRALEWSISRGYDDLRRLGDRDFPNLDTTLPAGPNWLAELVCRGAEDANSYYEKLMAHYDIQRGLSDPPAGLDQVARRIVARLIRYATLSFARVLERAVDESDTHPPEVSLTAPMLLATAQIPFKLIARRITDAEERRLVENMYDELVTTGTVEQHLPEDDRVVRDLHRQEIVAKQSPLPTVSKVFPFKARERVITRVDQRRAERNNVVAFSAASADVRAREKRNIAPEPARPTAGLTERLEKVALRVADQSLHTKQGSDGPRYYLTLDQDVVDGPSVGPKTAERLYPHGIKTVRDLMKADPAALAVLVDTKHITPEAISAWQDQARLVCTVPGLRGTHAQLLVGAGYHSAESIAAAEPEKLCADVLAFAASAVGQRLLRNGDPPDIEKIKTWLEAARSVKAA